MWKNSNLQISDMDKNWVNCINNLSKSEKITIIHQIYGIL